MGCVCCSLSSFVSLILDACERATLCTVCAMLVCCLLFTILMMLILGIGVGFHYCYVQNSVESMGKAAKAAGAQRSGDTRSGPVMRSLDRAMTRGVYPGYAAREGRARRDLPGVPPPINNVLKQLNFTSDNFENSTESMDLLNFTRIIKNVTGFAS